MQLTRDFPLPARAIGFERLFIWVLRVVVPLRSAGCTFAPLCALHRGSMGASFLLAACGHADLRCCYMFGTGLVRDLGRRYRTSYMYVMSVGVCDLR